MLVFLCLCYHKVSDNFTYMTCYSIPFYFSDKRQVTGSCFKTEIHTFTAIIIAETYLRRITKFLSLLGKMSRCDKILSEYVPFFISSLVQVFFEFTKNLHCWQKVSRNKCQAIFVQVPSNLTSLCILSSAIFSLLFY